MLQDLARPLHVSPAVFDLSVSVRRALHPESYLGYSSELFPLKQSSVWGSRMQLDLVACGD